MGGDDFLRAGRMLAQGDLRLLALALIAEQPRHGYEIIKLLEEKTGGWYSPSPGVVYPTLTYLEETGYVTATTEGNKKLYAITEDGQTYLDQNRPFIDAVMDRLNRLGERFRRARRERESDLPRSIEAALLNLREVAARRIEREEGSETDIIEALMRAAREISGKP